MTTINTTRATVNEYYQPGEGWNVGDSFRLGGNNFLYATDKQGASFARVVERQGRDAYKFAYYDHLDNCLCIQFAHITIGIEADGYAHS